MNKRKIFCMFDMQNKTWNIMDAEENTCIFYGDIDGVENWLVENEGMYEEQLRQ